MQRWQQNDPGRVLVNAGALDAESPDRPESPGVGDAVAAVHAGEETVPRVLGAPSPTEYHSSARTEVYRTNCERKGSEFGSLRDRRRRSSGP
jgi:hypothetical protein